MEPIVWSDRFSVGVKKLDNQHKQLISLLNKIIRSPNAQTSSETISDILTAMTRYAREHFQLEESLMEKYHYSQLDQHKKTHASFFNNIAKLSLATMKNDNIVPLQLLEYLNHWLQRHILEEDMLYKPFLAHKGIDE